MGIKLSCKWIFPFWSPKQCCVRGDESLYKKPIGMVKYGKCVYSVF